jgi:carboxypeptidase Q
LSGSEYDKEQFLPENIPRLILTNQCWLSNVLRVACCFLFTVPVWTQTSPASPSAFSQQVLQDLGRVQKTALASDYGYRLTEHLSDNIGPRLSGSPQYQKAADYVAEQMRQLGLEVTMEKVMVPHWVRGKESGELVEFPGQTPNTTQKTALGASVATPAEGIIAPVVVVNSMEELNALGREKVNGKIVLFYEKYDNRMAAQGFGLDAYSQAVAYRATGPSAAARLGAVAALVRSAGGGAYRLPHTGGTHYAKDVPKIPAAALAAEDADLLERLSQQRPVKMHLTLTPEILPDAVGWNVIGDLKGTEHPEQVVILSGHLDSWDLGTGAIDDAAGVGIAMQAIETIKSLGLRRSRTLRVIAWANEENGLKGGLTYAFEHQAQLADHYAAIESDLGAGHPAGFYFAGDVKLKGILKPVSKVLESSGAGLAYQTEETGSDLIPMGVQGVPTFAPMQDNRTYFLYHHTPADTFDKIDVREFQENAAAVAVLGYALANSTAVLPRQPQTMPSWLKEEQEMYQKASIR